MSEKDIDIEPVIEPAPKNVLTEEERKERYIQYLLNMQDFDYFAKHSCVIDGKSRRRLRKEITAKVNKGRIKIPNDIDLNNYEVSQID